MNAWFFVYFGISRAIYGNAEHGKEILYHIATRVICERMAPLITLECITNAELVTRMELQRKNNIHLHPPSHRWMRQFLRHNFERVEGNGIIMYKLQLFPSGFWKVYSDLSA